jgi:hypothetical protein
MKYFIVAFLVFCISSKLVDDDLSSKFEELNNIREIKGKLNVE